MNTKLSIIVPVLNEEQNLARTLDQLINQTQSEVIVVDGGSTDATRTLARQAGCTVISSPKGRGKQMNTGVEASNGGIVLFVHGDTTLPHNFPQIIRDTLARPGVVAGAFSLGIDNPMKRFAIICWFANLRSRYLQLPYGDQAIFTTRKNFDSVGGYREMEILEDYVFVRQLKKKGTIALCRERAITSARRWQNIGIVTTTLTNQLIIFGHSIGVPPVTLFRWYRRLKGVSSPRE